MPLKHYWTEGISLQNVSTHVDGSNLTQIGYVETGTSQNIGDVLLRTVSHVRISGTVTAAGGAATAPDPGVWLDSQFLVGLWCDAGRAPQPEQIPVPGITLNPDPEWLALVQLVPHLSVDPMGAARGRTEYQVSWEPPGGVIDVAAIRSGKGASTLSRTWLTWRCDFPRHITGWNSQDGDGNSWYFGGMGYERSLWGTSH